MNIIKIMIKKQRVTKNFIQNIYNKRKTKMINNFCQLRIIKIFLKIMELKVKTRKKIFVN